MYGDVFMSKFSETFEVEYFDGRKGLLEECCVYPNGSIFSKGNVNNLGIGDILVRVQPNGYTECLRVKWISQKASPLSGSKEIKVQEI
jgi:hypothetical protein